MVLPSLTAPLIAVMSCERDVYAGNNLACVRDTPPRSPSGRSSSSSAAAGTRPSGPEELHVEFCDHPGRLPERDGDPLLAVDGRLQRRGHAGGAAFDELQLEAVLLDGIARCRASGPEPGSMPMILPPNLSALSFSCVDRVDRHVFRNGERLVTGHGKPARSSRAGSCSCSSSPGRRSRSARPGSESPLVERA